MRAESVADQQPRRVTAEDRGAVRLGDVERSDAVEHFAQASDLMRVVAAGEDMIGSGEVDRQLQRAHIEVHRVVVELAKIFAGRLVDIGAAFFEGMKSAIEPLDKVRNRPAK